MSLPGFTAAAVFAPRISITPIRSVITALELQTDKGVVPAVIWGWHGYPCYSLPDGSTGNCCVRYIVTSIHA
jgi:hypothetical protein